MKPDGKAHDVSCGDYCGNHGCNQGRNCPVRQSCELPEPGDGHDPKDFLDVLIGIATAVVVVATCLMLSIILIPMP